MKNVISISLCFIVLVFLVTYAFAQEEIFNLKNKNIISFKSETSIISGIWGPSIDFSRTIENVDTHITQHLAGWYLRRHEVRCNDGRFYMLSYKKRLTNNLLGGVIIGEYFIKHYINYTIAPDETSWDTWNSWFFSDSIQTIPVICEIEKRGKYVSYGGGGGLFYTNFKKEISNTGNNAGPPDPTVDYTYTSITPVLHASIELKINISNSFSIGADSRYIVELYTNESNQSIPAEHYYPLNLSGYSLGFNLTYRYYGIIQ